MRGSRKQRVAGRWSAVAALSAAALLVTPAAYADPVLTTTGTNPAVGALPVDAAVSNTPKPVFPQARQQAPACTFANVSSPDGIQIKHVAPCASATGDGSAGNPWKTIAQAMAGLRPNQAAYVHGSGGASWTGAPDYRESNLQPTTAGTGANARIWLVAAPGENPKIASNGDGRSILLLTKSWWVLDGLALDAKGVAFSNNAVRIGNPSLSTPTQYVVLRRLKARTGNADPATVPKTLVAFDGAKNSALLDSINPNNPNDPNYGVTEELDANGRPRTMPADSSDHHGITALNGADRILLRNNNSYGHNGDSFQCGEEEKTTTYAPVTNVTLENNRFHQDEENAVDLKVCQGVTVRGNKFFSYRPARPYATKRSGQGDAVVVHGALDTPRSADRVLIELNRFWDNSRSVNIDGQVPTAVVRRNLIFNSTSGDCGMGAGITIRAQRSEVYHNTIDNMSPQGPAPNCTYDRDWSTNQEAALRIAPGETSKQVTYPQDLTAQVWNNIISRAPNAYTVGPDTTIQTRRNLFSQPPATRPDDSLVQDPLFVTNPVANDYYTQRGSPARDAAAPVSPSVADPAASTYCDDPTPTENDLTVEPDIGFLESCS